MSILNWARNTEFGVFRGRQKTVTSGNYLPHAEFPWLMAVVLVTILPHFLHLPYWIITVTLSILLYFFLRRRQGYQAASAWIKVPVVLFVAAAIVLDSSYIDKAGIAALTFCITGKLLELKGRRDVMVIVVLGYFLLLTHYFNSQDFLTGAWLFAGALVVTSALLHLYDDPAKPARKTLKTAFFLLLQAIPLALVLYLLFPRVDGPLWAIQRMQSSQTGLSESMRPGQISQLVQSSEIAFRVQFHDPIPPRHQLYWRGPVFSNYDGQSWTSNDYRRQAPPIEVQGEPTRYSIILEPHHRFWLLPLEMPTSFTGIPNAYFTGGGVLQSPHPITSRTRMEFVSHLEYRMDEGELSGFARRVNLQLPVGRNNRSRAFAEQLWRENPTPGQMSARLLRFFRDEPFYYTLDPPLLGINAMDDFIFNSRQGFCEHYASAYVVLMRAAGVPARVVTGYLGGEVNPVDLVLTVRQYAAHAWAEFWTAENGWTRVDPTAVIPPERIDPEVRNRQNDNSPELMNIALEAFNLLQRARYYWQALDNRWNQWVLGYTPERQREFLSRLGLYNPDLKKISIFFAAGTTLFLIPVAFVILRKRRRPVEPALAVWLSACKKLNRRGIETPHWETPLALVERMQTTCPERAELNAALLRLARLVYAVRYENTPVHMRFLKQARARLDQCP